MQAFFYRFTRYFCERLWNTIINSFIFCFASVFISADIIFLQLFRTSFNIICKRFLRQIFLFLQIHPTPPPTPLNNKNLLSVTKKFLSIFKCLLNFLKNICSLNPAKACFMYEQWTATVHMFWCSFQNMCQ